MTHLHCRRRLPLAAMTVAVSLAAWSGGAAAESENGRTRSTSARPVADEADGERNALLARAMAAVHSAMAPRQPAALDGASAEQQGIASFYGRLFHQRKTASGEKFDMRALTAAHPTLPFGTRVCVQSQVNGRQVAVRINDRGPHVRGRIIDLSQGAAEAIDMLGRGTKAVVLRVLGREEDCS